MCGRFSLGANREEIINQLVQDGVLPQFDEQEWLDRDDFYPRYNIAPRSRAAVIRRRYGSPAEETRDDTTLHNANENTHEEGPSKAKTTTEHSPPTIIQTMRWGLVPRYAKADLPSVTANTINARVESILEGNRTWGSVINTHRCVVICDG
jgi:putative SOS response-associated peptidase YedK